MSRNEGPTSINADLQNDVRIAPKVSQDVRYRKMRLTSVFVEKNMTSMKIHVPPPTNKKHKL